MKHSLLSATLLSACLLAGCQPPMASGPAVGATAAAGRSLALRLARADGYALQAYRDVNRVSAIARYVVRLHQVAAGGATTVVNTQEIGPEGRITFTHLADAHYRVEAEGQASGGEVLTRPASFNFDLTTQVSPAKTAAEHLLPLLMKDVVFAASLRLPSFQLGAGQLQPWVTRVDVSVTGTAIGGTPVTGSYVAGSAAVLKDLPNEGTYDVTLTAHGANGVQVSDTKTVTVSDNNDEVPNPGFILAPHLEDASSAVTDGAGGAWTTGVVDGNYQQRVLIHLDGQGVRTVSAPVAGYESRVYADGAGGVWLSANSGTVTVSHATFAAGAISLGASHGVGYYPVQAMVPDGGTGVFVVDNKSIHHLGQTDNAITAGVKQADAVSASFDIYSWKGELAVSDGDGGVWVRSQTELVHVTEDDDLTSQALPGAGTEGLFQSGTQVYANATERLNTNGNTTLKGTLYGVSEGAPVAVSLPGAQRLMFGTTDGQGGLIAMLANGNGGGLYRVGVGVMPTQLTEPGANSFPWQSVTPDGRGGYWLGEDKYYPSGSQIRPFTVTGGQAIFGTPVPLGPFQIGGGAYGGAQPAFRSGSTLWFPTQGGVLLGVPDPAP